MIDGVQYVVVAAGGNKLFGYKTGDEVLVFRLRNATEITSLSVLPYHPSSVLRLQLHRPGYAPVVAP